MAILYDMGERYTLIFKIEAAVTLVLVNDTIVPFCWMLYVLRWRAVLGTSNIGILDIDMCKHALISKYIAFQMK